MTLRDRLTLTVIALAVSLVIMDATIVNVALPVVIRDLNLSSSDAEWMNAGYALMFAAFLLTLGRLGDLFGRRLLLVTGLVVFVLASLVAGSATGPVMLIGARLVQGLGAAMIMPAALSTLNAIFTGRARQIAFAVYGATIGGMAAVGPLLGGWLATDVSWRWAFWLNVPAVLVALALSRSIQETRDPDLHRSLDLVGALMSSLGMGAVVFGFIESGSLGWWLQDDGTLSPVPVSIALGVVIMAAFVWVESRRLRAGKVVLVDLRLFRIPTFRYGVIAALIVSMGEFGLLFTLPLFLQGALAYDSLGTGWLILALAAGTFVTSGLTPMLTRSWGARAVVRLGLALEALAVAGVAVFASTSATAWEFAPCLFVYGAGVGLATTQLTSIIMSEVPVAESGQASGVQSSIRQLGSALGVAVLGSVLVSTLTRGTETRLEAVAVPSAPRATLVDIVHHSVGAAIQELDGLVRNMHLPVDPAAVVHAAQEAMASASRWSSGLAAAVLVVGLAATLALPKSAGPAAAGEPESSTVDEAKAGTS